MLFTWLSKSRSGATCWGVLNFVSLIRLSRWIVNVKVHLDWEKVNAKEIFSFYLCRCSIWTLYWILCEPIWKRRRFRFRVNINSYSATFARSLVRLSCRNMNGVVHTEIQRSLLGSYVCFITPSLVTVDAGLLLRLCATCWYQTTTTSYEL